MKLTGECYCGALRYEAGGRPLLKAQCHCRECQYLSGGGPNYFMLMPDEAFAYTRGTPKTFRRTDIPDAVTREFCEICGTHIITRRTDQTALVLKVGTLDDTERFDQPVMAIFACDRQSFHHVADDIPVYDRLPPRPGKD
ncbi:MAG: GFA family protein [Pseudomonadota bacterium]